VTRRDPSVGQALVQSLRMELHRYCYGTASLLDLNNGGTSL